MNNTNENLRKEIEELEAKTSEILNKMSPQQDEQIKALEEYELTQRQCEATKDLYEAEIDYARRTAAL